MFMNKKGFAGSIISTVVGIVLILSVLLTVVLDQVRLVNTSALGTAGTSILNILGLGVVILALVLIFAPMMGKR
jgi:heme/copper-type cytochrome/quinol oxidase subunit 4